MFEFLIILLPLAFVIGNPFYRTYFLRKLTKRNYAIIYFKIGKQLIATIKNMDKDILRYKDGIFIFLNGQTYYKTNSEKKIIKINPSKIYFQSGIPTIFFDINSMTPLSLHKTSNINPYHIQNLISKELSITEAEALKMSQSSLSKMMKIILIIAIISVALSGISLLMLMNATKGVIVHV